MTLSDYNHELLNFLNTSPTPFHAVASSVQLLEAAGFQRLHENSAWQLSAGNYFVTRNDSSIVAFVLTADDLTQSGLRLVGAHTDSPCLKVKPQPELRNKNYAQLGVEVYGGALLNPWFDRDLSIAGRVSFIDSQGQLASRLIDFKKPVATIPSLAIHLDREANQSRSINAQNHLPPLLLQIPVNGEWNWREMLLTQLRHEHADCDVIRVLDFELSLYDTQPAALVGMQQEFISSARLDNLLSCFTGLKALINASAAAQKQSSVLILSDHEEVGSQSAAGAQGPFLKSILERIVGGGEKLTRVLDRSLLISTDNAHGVHPNYADKHDGNHGPLLNGGPVIKINHNQRYATNSETSAFFRQLCEQQNIAVQTFVVRSDMACGSTIGPITAAELGVKTVDVGVPQLAMHSIRELAGTQDALSLAKVLQAFFLIQKLP
jgi:aspartyl aminopeptidase